MDYNSINFLEERELVDSLNMTARLSPFQRITALTRAFHIVTIVGRLLSPWVWSLSRTGPKRYLEKHPMTPQMRAGYLLFRDEVFKAVACLPDKEAFDVNSESIVSVLEPLYDAFPEIETLECVDPIQHIRTAWNIHNAIWGKGMDDIARNCANFLEIARDEFYTYGNVAPTLSEERASAITAAMQEELTDEIRFYWNRRGDY